MAEWDERDLPAPAVRSVVAAVETSEAFGERCVREAERLGLNDPTQLNILGDGAEWVGNLAGKHFPAARQLLDIWHGAEHVAEGAKKVFGSGSAEWLTDRPRRWAYVSKHAAHAGR